MMAWRGDRRSWATSAAKAASCRLASSNSASRFSSASWRERTSSSPPNSSRRTLAAISGSRVKLDNGPEDVAHAPHGVDEPRTVLLQLPPERADVDLHEVQVVVLEAPHLGEELGL